MVRIFHLIPLRGYFRLAGTCVLFFLLPLVAHAENLVVNGGFDGNLNGWTASAISGPLSVSTTSGSNCYEQNGNPAAAFNVYSNRKSALEQSITLPNANSITLKFLAWGQLDPTTLVVKIKDTNSVEHTLDSFVAVRLIQGYTFPGPVFTCTGSAPEMKTYDLSQFAGQTVTLHFDATSTGSDGTFAIIDNVEVAPSDSPPGGNLRSTAVKLFCNRSGDLTTVTCVATVGDTGAPPRTNPTGEVQFTATEGTLAGTSCLLQGVSFSPGVASCSMTYFPPAGFPIGKAFPVSATYVGDTAFNASSVLHELIFAACVGTEAKPCPNSVGLEFDRLPAIIDKVVSMLATCGGGASTQMAHASGSGDVVTLIDGPIGGACALTAAMGIDIEKLIKEMPKADLDALYGAYGSAPPGKVKEAVFKYLQAASPLEEGYYRVLQENQPLMDELVRSIEKNLTTDYEKLFNKYQIGRARGANNNNNNKKKRQSLIKFATVTREVGSNRSTAIKFKLNKRAQELVTFLKQAGITTVPLKATMTVRQKKRFGQATLTQSVDVVLK